MTFRRTLFKRGGHSASRSSASLMTIVLASSVSGSAFGQFGLQLEIEPPNPLDTEGVTVIVSGDLPDTCYWYGGGAGSWVNGTYRIDLYIELISTGPCATVLVPFQQSFDLGVLPAGKYGVEASVFVPQTGQSESVETTFLVWPQPAETIIVDLPEITGFYETEEERILQLDLGSWLFQIDSVGIQWVGWITMGIGECLGKVHGVGGEFLEWQGDVPAERRFDDPLLLTMDSDKNITAVFQTIPDPTCPGACGSGCGCTPGASAMLLIFIGLLGMRFIGTSRPRRRDD